MILSLTIDDYPNPAYDPNQEESHINMSKISYKIDFNDEPDTNVVSLFIQNQASHRLISNLLNTNNDLMNCHKLLNLNEDITFVSYEYVLCSKNIGSTDDNDLDPYQLTLNTIMNNDGMLEQHYYIDKVIVSSNIITNNRLDNNKYLDAIKFSNVYIDVTNKESLLKVFEYYGKLLYNIDSRNDSAYLYRSVSEKLNNTVRHFKVSNMIDIVKDDINKRYIFLSSTSCYNLDCVEIDSSFTHNMLAKLAICLVLEVNSLLEYTNSITIYEPSYLDTMFMYDLLYYIIKTNDTENSNILTKIILINSTDYLAHMYKDLKNNKGLSMKSIIV